MKMNYMCLGFALMLASSVIVSQTSQENPKLPRTFSLCELQTTAKPGTRRAVIVDGLFGSGLDHGTLEDPDCPGQLTWVELKLSSKDKNREKLKHIKERKELAYILVEGEFFGPDLPDPNLPEKIRKAYSPGWGHLAAFRTKLEVHSILDVQDGPEDSIKPGK